MPACWMKSMHINRHTQVCNKTWGMAEAEDIALPEQTNKDVFVSTRQFSKGEVDFERLEQ